MEDPKKIRDDKKEKESPELKDELTEDELKGVTGGVGVSGILSAAEGLLPDPIQNPAIPP